MRLWRDDPVPQSWRGLWRRVALERADGTGDVTSLVLWLQTETHYVDLRIPIDRPTVRAFDARLAAQEGFAGPLLHDGDCARWERWVDYRPLGAPDEGRLDRERRMMVERGLHDAYVEHWWHDAPGSGRDTEVVLAEPAHIVVRAGRHLMMARDRRSAAPDDLVAACAGGTDLEALLDCEVSYAVRADGGWRIAASTLPWREGVMLTARDLQHQRPS